MKIVLPTQEIFEKPVGLTESQISDVRLKEVIKVEIKDGEHLVWYKGLKYPKRLSVHPMAGIKTAIVKRIFRDGLRLFFSPPLCYFVGASLILFPRKTFNLVTERFIKFADWTFKMYSNIGIELLQSSYISPAYLCKSGKEIQRVCLKMFGEMPAKIVSTIWECDNAYRYKLQDFFGIIDKREVIRRPRKEILRGLDEFLKRHNDKNELFKFKQVRFLISLGLFLPPIRKKIKEFFQEIDFERVRLDKWDFYYCCLRPTYNFKGIPYEKRQKWFKYENSQPPPQASVDTQIVF